MSTKLETDQSSYRVECERAMHAIFAVLGVPASYFDVECTDGFLVRAARMFGCKPSLGQTRSWEVKRVASRYAHLVVAADKLVVVGRFELITAMHGDPVWDVTPLLSEGGHLVVASAFPCGKGEMVNGLSLDLSCTDSLQATWAGVAESLPRYVRVYTK